MSIFYNSILFITLPKIYTTDELMQLADDFYHVFVRNFDDSYMNYPTKKHKSFLSRNRNYTMLTFIVYQGITTTELTQICINDIDMQKARLTLNNGETIRNLPINAAQMGAIINYINNIRPQFLDFCEIICNTKFSCLLIGQ